MKITIKGQPQQTTMGDLRMGEYFRYPNGERVYQVVKNHHYRSATRILMAAGPNQHQYFYEKSPNTPVIPLTLTEMIFEETN